MIHIWFIFSLALLLNIVLGCYRYRYKKFTFMWFFLIHASLFVVLPLRLYLEVPSHYSPWVIATAVLGQFVGARLLPRLNK